MPQNRAPETRWLEEDQNGAMFLAPEALERLGDTNFQKIEVQISRTEISRTENSHIRQEEAMEIRQEETMKMAKIKIKEESASVRKR